MNICISPRWLTLAAVYALILFGCARERGRTDIALEMTDEDSVEAIIDQDLLTAGGTIINIEQDAGTNAGTASTVAYVDDIDMQKPVLVETDEQLKPPVSEPETTSVSGLEEPLVDTRDLAQDTESILADLDVPPVDTQIGTATVAGTTPSTTPSTIPGTLAGGTTTGTLAVTDMNAMAREAATPALPSAETGPLPISTPSGYYPNAYRTPLPSSGYQRHTVVRGDSLWSISRKYGCSVSELAAANGMTRSTVLQIGQELTVPVAAKPAPPSSTPATVASAPASTPDTASPDPAALPVAGGTPAGTTTAPADAAIRDVATDTYTVVQGDSYWKIARMYGISAQELMALNDTSDSRLRIGQTILVPKR